MGHRGELVSWRPVFDRAESIRQLEESLRLLERAVAATPERWHRPDEPELPQEFWGVAMNLAHLAIYEERIAAPVLEALADGGDGADAIRPGATPDWEEREAAELSPEPVERILARLRAARERQIAAVGRMPDERFATATTPHWGQARDARPKSAAWVAAKTVQHTWEHGNSVMQIALFHPP
jgi:hypothetical protein